jgi:hypothetical protein
MALAEKGYSITFILKGLLKVLVSFICYLFIYLDGTGV